MTLVKSITALDGKCLPNFFSKFVKVMVILDSFGLEFPNCHCSFRINFLPHNEAITPRAVFVIVSGLDGQKRIWGQLNN